MNIVLDNMNTVPLDLSAVDFPSDHLTIRDLRKMNGDDIFLEKSDALDSMLAAERLCVEVGYRLAMGETPDNIEISGLSQSEIKEDLAELYLQFGVAEGPETVAYHIERLQEAGARQARQPKFR